MKHLAFSTKIILGLAVIALTIGYFSLLRSQAQLSLPLKTQNQNRLGGSGKLTCPEGLVATYCEGGLLNCVEVATDSGKPCTDSDQCQGYCINPQPYPWNNPTSTDLAKCSSFRQRVCGCFTSVGDNVGKREFSGCID